MTATQKMELPTAERAANISEGIAYMRGRADALAEVQAERYDEVKRQADHAHRERIHAEIAEDLAEAAMDDNSYEDEINAIAAGKVRHLRIIY